jgi:deoxyribonuclease-4
VSSRIRIGPARVPSQESPEAAVEILLERGYSACEIDFESGFWMDYPFAERLGELARDSDIALSVHAPLFGFMGHLEASGRKFASAVGALDRSAGISAASGAELVVFHPGFLLGRSREDAIDAVVEQLGMLRERLEDKERAVPFGVEVMGRVRDLGSLDDVIAISARTRWVRPVLDFAHMHATSDGAFLEADRFAEALAAVDGALEAGAPFHIHKSDSKSPHPEAASEDLAPFHIHVSDIAFANRNEKHHLPYGEGTLRVGPLRDALAQFGRPATIISESPDEESSQIIKDVLLGLREDIPGPATQVS